MTLDRPATDDPSLALPDDASRIAEFAASYTPGPSKPPGVAAYAVGQVAAYLRELLDTDPVVGDIWVSGEVLNLSRSQAGHVYFTLGDADGALACVFFRRENRGVLVQEGEQVLVHGRVSLWAERGDLQLYVDALQPEGLGVQQAEFERLRRRLEAEGLFDPGRKRRLPAYPRAIGVATSPAGPSGTTSKPCSRGAGRWRASCSLPVGCRATARRSRSSTRSRRSTRRRATARLSTC